MKCTVEDIKKPRLQGHSRSSASLKMSIAPLAWKASLFFWRRWVKRIHAKPHVIKSASSLPPSSPVHHWSPCARSKDVSMPTEYTAKNSNFFYYSYPDHNPCDSKCMYGCCDAVKTRMRPHLPNTACVTPTPCDDNSPNLNISRENALPYFQLHHAQCGVLAKRLPLYMVS